MKLLRRCATISFLCLLPVLAAGQTIEDMVTEFTLDNGLKFVVVERHTAPVFFAAMVFRVGSINEWDGVTGISHMLEHMMFKGTRTVGTESYSRERRYLEREDEIAADIQDFRQRIGAWRISIFQDFSRQAIASLDQARKQEIGSDRIEELKALIELLETGNAVPPEAAMYPTLIHEGDTDFMELYVNLKNKELELEEVMVEHADLIISEELWDAYLQNGARMLNAFTSNDMTGYIVYLPANRLELWMMLESDRMADPIFREFHSERNVVAEERRLHENDHESVLYDELMAAAFKASPYGRPVIGWMSDIQAYTTEDLREYYGRFYAPNNAFVIMVGDLDPDAVERMARRYFGDIPSQEPPEPVVTTEPEQVGERRVTVEFPANPEVMIGYHVPTGPHPDYYALQVLTSILASGRTSRLYKSVYEDLELTSSSPRVTFEPGEKIDNLLVIHAIPRHPHTTEEVERAIYAEIEAIKNQPPTDREMQKVRNQVDASMVRMLDSTFGIVFNLGRSEAMRGDWRAFLEDVERVKQVTAEDISRVAAQYLVPRKRTVATLVKSEAEGEGEAEQIDLRALMEWVRSLPEEEQMEIFQKVQSMTEQQRMEYARELIERMGSENQ
jgi:predicted Zn-dependent peptidase